MLCSSRHHPAPKSQTETLSPSNTNSQSSSSAPNPGPWHLPTYFLTLSVTILGISCKWNQTVFACTYCILECIFKITLIYDLQTECTFFFPLCYTVVSHQLSLLYVVVYNCQSQLPNFSQPPFPSWCPYICFLVSICLYVCVFISALQIVSSVLFFYIPHMCINVHYLFCSFWHHFSWQSPGPSTWKDGLKGFSKFPRPEPRDRSCFS